MTVRILDARRLGEFVAALLEAYRVYAPVRREGELRFDRVSDSDEVVWNYRNTTRAPKAVMFPQSECMIRFEQRLDRLNEVKATPLDETPTLVLGIRPCDVRGLLLFDRVFGQGEFLDPYYLARRENTLLVAMACDRPRATCFCHAFGSGPYDAQGADVWLRKAGDDYLIEVLSKRGAALEAYLGRLPEADATHLALAEETERAALERLSDIEPVAGIEAVLAGLFDSPLWAEVSEKCLACGTCTYNCPGCHCFNIEDRVLAGGGDRVRAWDSCMYPTFTQHASGHNPRPDQAARWRQRTMHKFEYLPRNVGLYGCVGCGRCIQSCPVRLDIRQVLRRVRQEEGSGVTA